MAACAVVDGVVPEGHAGRPEGARRPADADGRGARREQDSGVPEWSGKWLGTPPDVQYKRGSRYPDPFASEKPVATITAENMAQYAEHLTDGQKAMFKRYPATFKIIVYPSHRDFRYADAVQGHPHVRTGFDDDIRRERPHERAADGALPDP